MAYQKKVTTSYGTRLKNSLGGIKTGAILFALGTILLFANEGFYVKTNKAIQETKSSLKWSGDITTADSSLDGKLIHAYGKADTTDVLADPLFGVSATAIRLTRRVEYYQHQQKSSEESKDKLGGAKETTSTYTYPKAWVSSPVNSGSFEDPEYKKANFVLTTVENKSVSAANVSFGSYKLPPFIINSISGNTPADINLGAAELQQWENEITKNLANLGKKSDGGMVQVQGNVLYFGKSPSNPAIGDVRVTLTKVMPQDISIIARMVGNSFEKFIASNGWEFPNSVDMGIVSADTMIARAKSLNSFITWLLRFLGIFMIVVGLKALFGFLPTLLKVLPPLGKIVGAGVGLVCTIGGFAWSLVIIAIAWLFYRPLVAIPMLIIAGGGIFLLTKMKSKKKAGQAAAAAASAASAGWDCPCGQKANTGKFCAGCGKPQPAPPAAPATWDCPCGQKANTGKFCAGCGKPQPWDCPCGRKANTGKFCADCGKPQP